MERYLQKATNEMDSSKIYPNSSMAKDNTIIINENFSAGEGSNLFINENLSIPLNDFEFINNDQLDYNNDDHEINKLLLRQKTGSESHSVPRRETKKSLFS